MVDRPAWVAIVGFSALAFVVGLGVGVVVLTDDTTPAFDTVGSSSSTETAEAAPTSDADTADGTSGAPPGSVLALDDGQTPIYGSDEERQMLVDVAEGLNIAGVFSDQELLLATADSVCHDLERLVAQNRSPAYATRVVWNESLAELDSMDLAGFATVFSLAPIYLCPEYTVFAVEISYILGI